MSDKSKIEWTNATWNPVVGCTKCSPGCENCYAERMCRRFWKKWGMLAPPHHFGVKWFPDRLDIPLHWREPRRIFVCSMSDLFHPKVPSDFKMDVYSTITQADWHTFQILTKRINGAINFYNEWEIGDYAANKTFKNLWLGVSVSTQKEADEKIPILLQIPAAIRFVSIEPMLEMIDLSEMLPGHYWYDWEKGCLIDWIIVGGESGPKRRWCNIRWVDSIVEQCKAADVPCFVKQIHRDGKLIKMPKEYPQKYPYVKNML